MVDSSADNDISASFSARIVLIAAPGSGHGKTTLTAALAAAWTRRGHRVRVFKLGPDYLDPTILEQASKSPVYNLDLWIMGEAHIRALLREALQSCDVILIESLMGLHDHSPSSAEFAKRFGLPVVLVLDVAKLAQTSAAIVDGIIRFDDGVRLQAVVANRLGSRRHAELIEQSLRPVTHYAGGLMRDDRLELPQRHLGLVQAMDLQDLDQTLADAAVCIEQSGIDVWPAPVEIAGGEPEKSGENRLAGVRIAIARDRAFGFIYPANVDLLNQLGARCVFFSPLADEPLPSCDALWLPGGYPELHLEQLAASDRCFSSIRAHIDSNKPTLAECGGMMVLGQHIKSVDGQVMPAGGVLDAEFTMHGRFQSVGPVTIGTMTGELRGHSFHHSSIKTSDVPLDHVTRQNGQRGSAIYRHNQCYASYAHWYFPSDGEAIANLFLGQSWLRNTHSDACGSSST